MHPYCDSCAFNAKIGRGLLCTPDNTCDTCKDVKPEVWIQLKQYRDYKVKRRERTLSKKTIDSSTIDAVIHQVAHADSYRIVQTVEYEEISDDSDSEVVVTEQFDNLNTDYSSSTSGSSMGGKKESKKLPVAATPKPNELSGVAAQLKVFEDQVAKMKVQMASSKTAADVSLSPDARRVDKPSTSAAAARAKSPSLPPKAKYQRKSSRERRSARRSTSGERRKRKSRSKSRRRSPRKVTRRSASRSISRSRDYKRSKRSRSRDRRSRSGTSTVRYSSPRRDSREDRRRSREPRRKASRERSNSRRRDRSHSDRRHRSPSLPATPMSQRRMAEYRLEKEEEQYRREADKRERRKRSRSPRERDDRRTPSKERDYRQRMVRSNELEQRYGKRSSPQTEQRAVQLFEQYKAELERKADEERAFVDPDSDDDEAPEPTKAAFPFKEVVNLMAEFSDVKLTAGDRFSSKQFAMASDDPSNVVEKEFLALTTTSGLVTAVKMWEEEFARKDLQKKGQKKVKLNELYKCGKLKAALRSYKSGDEWLTTDTLFHEQQAYSWLAEPSAKIPVLQADLAYMESQMRNMLRVINFIEVLNQTVNAGLQKPFEPEVMGNLHKCNKQATRELIKLATGMFCGIAQLRKDDIIQRSPNIPYKLAFKLRHSPLANVTSMFPEEVLVEIDNVYSQQLQTSTMERYTSSRGGAKGRGKQPYHTPRGDYKHGFDGHKREFKHGQKGKGFQGSAR